VAEEIRTIAPLPPWVLKDTELKGGGGGKKGNMPNNSNYK
jgi:hypothetical protein